MLRNGLRSPPEQVAQLNGILILSLFLRYLFQFSRHPCANTLGIPASISPSNFLIDLLTVCKILGAFSKSRKREKTAFFYCSQPTHLKKLRSPKDNRK